MIPCGAPGYTLPVAFLTSFAEACRHIELLEVFGKVRLRKCRDAVECILVAGHHSLEPEGIGERLRDLDPRPVEAEERAAGQVLGGGTEDTRTTLATPYRTWRRVALHYIFARGQSVREIERRGASYLPHTHASHEINIAA